MLLRRTGRGASKPPRFGASDGFGAAPVAPMLEALEALAADPLAAADVVAVTTDVGELLLHADDGVMTPIIRTSGRWEEDEAAWMRSILGPGQTVIDCGANLGYFSVLAAGIVGPGGRVLAVEPERANLRLLRHNLWRNGADNVQVIPAAAADTRGTLALRFNAGNRGDHQVHAEAGAGDILVPAVVLDDLLPAGRVDLVKVDTQGSDHLVLAGMRRVLERSPRAHVLVEFWLDSLEGRGVSPAGVLAGYRALERPIGILGGDGVVAPMDDAAIIAAAEATAPAKFVNLVLGPRTA